MSVHPTAILSPQTELDSGVTIGPYAVTRGRVFIGKNTQIDSHVVLGSENGLLEMGEFNRVHSGAVIGGAPQDLKYKNEPTSLIVGKGNTFREFVTVNIGTESGGGITRIGDYNLFMAYVHVAHDCELGNQIVVANTTNFAGHVKVEDYVRIGGVCSFNQFITVGRYSYIAGDSTVNKDVLPFTIAQGKYAVSRATNKIGLDRAGFSKDEIDNIHRAVRFVLMGDRTKEEFIEKIIQECQPSDSIEHLLQFIRSSARGIAK